MCTFLVLNISSLQLIPVTVIAYRSQYVAGSGRDYLEQRSLLRQFPQWQGFVRKNYVCNR